jgi:hypothetical protein
LKRSIRNTPRGDEQKSLKGDSNVTYNSGHVKRWPKSGTDSAQTPENGQKSADSLPNDLAKIVAVWPSLPEHIKAAIKAMIETFKANSK